MTAVKNLLRTFPLWSPKAREALKLLVSQVIELARLWRILEIVESHEQGIFTARLCSLGGNANSAVSLMFVFEEMPMLWLELVRVSDNVIYVFHVIASLTMELSTLASEQVEKEEEIVRRSPKR